MAWRAVSGHVTVSAARIRRRIVEAGLLLLLLLRQSDVIKTGVGCVVMAAVTRLTGHVTGDKSHMYTSTPTCMRMLMYMYLHMYTYNYIHVHDH